MSCVVCLLETSKSPGLCIGVTIREASRRLLEALWNFPELTCRTFSFLPQLCAPNFQIHYARSWEDMHGYNASLSVYIHSAIQTWNIPPWQVLHLGATCMLCLSLHLLHSAYERRDSLLAGSFVSHGNAGITQHSKLAS